MPVMVKMSDQITNRMIQQTDKNKLSFFIAAYDADIIRNIKRVMESKGYVGVLDTAGRIHYMIDGNKGSAHAARVITRKAFNLLDENSRQTLNINQFLPDIVNNCLKKHRMRTDLKGYRYLRYLLLITEADETKLKPVSKVLYPLAAEHYHVSVSNVERDIRYLINHSDFKTRNVKTAAAICTLFDEITRDLNHVIKQKTDAEAALESKNHMLVAESGYDNLYRSQDHSCLQT